MAEVVELVGVNQQSLSRMKRKGEVVDVDLSFGFQVEGQNKAMMRPILQRGLLQLIFEQSRKEQNMSGGRQNPVSNASEIVGWFFQFQQVFVDRVHKRSMACFYKKSIVLKMGGKSNFIDLIAVPSFYKTVVCVKF